MEAETQKAQNMTKSHLAAEQAHASAEIARLQKILTLVRKAGVTVEEMQHYDSDTPYASPALISLPGGNQLDGTTDEQGAAENATGSGEGGGGWGVESSTKAAVRAMRERRSQSPVPRCEELNECRGRGGESAGKPVKSSPEIGGVVEETNAADSVRAQVSMIESLFATSGSSLPLLADKAAATTADKGGNPEHLNAEAGGEGGAWHHSEKKTSGEDTDIADSKTLEPECTGGHIQSRDDGDREDGRNRLGGAATAEMPSSVKSQAFKCQCVSVCVCVALGRDVNSKPDVNQRIIPEACPPFSEADVPEMEEAYQELKVPQAL